VLRLFEPDGEAAWLRSFRFAVPLRPRYCETDALGHVSNVVYPEYLEYGRLQYFAAIGDPEPGPFPFAHVTAELHLRYVAAAYYDEPLEVRSKIVALGRSSATMQQALVGEGETLRSLSVVTVVRTGERPAHWTPAQRAAIEDFEPLHGE
jgi:acyl-CoA thioester hydrolase